MIRTNRATNHTINQREEINMQTVHRSCLAGLLFVFLVASFGCIRSVTDLGHVTLLDGSKLGFVSGVDETAAGPALKVLIPYHCDYARIQLPEETKPSALSIVYGHKGELYFAQMSRESVDDLVSSGLPITQAIAESKVTFIGQPIKILPVKSEKDTARGRAAGNANGDKQFVHYQSPEDIRCQPMMEVHASDGSLVGKILQGPTSVAIGGTAFILGQRALRPPKSETNISQGGSTVTGGNVSATGGQGTSTGGSSSAQGGAGGTGGQSTSISISKGGDARSKSVSGASADARSDSSSSSSSSIINGAVNPDP